MKDVPEEDRISAIDLEKNSLPTAKTLGVLWNANKDTFSFNYSFTPDMEFTERNVLKKTATIYDPLGFLAPHIVRAKLLIQQAWIEAADWDDPLPDHHQEQWKSWFPESTGLDRIRIPRCLKDSHSTAVKTSLHMFSDASEAAYAAACMTSWSCPHAPRVFRRLYHGMPNWIQDTAISLKSNEHSSTRTHGGGNWVKILNTSGSVDRSESRRKTDYASRRRERTDPESGTFTIIEEKNWRLNPARFSKWYRVSSNGQLEFGQSLVRVRGWVKWFINNCKVPNEHRIKEELISNELTLTELQIIQEAQREEYREEIIALTARKELCTRSHLLPLTPMLDAGILRANKKLCISDDLAREIKFPIILPKKHPVTQLILKYHYELDCHEMGINYTLDHLREKYHVIHSRQKVKRCIQNCYECKRRFRLHPAKQRMAPLQENMFYSLLIFYIQSNLRGTDSFYLT
ncbi:uncharacterized protein [Montipora capricornis]|uniref:uncharacterized protein n=1 Tax=Montipora capricornis TaxID=246305 RepID=UPI0035F1996A